jgi:hypothetical protein
MPTKQKGPGKEIWQIAVMLLETNPPIWRRLLVPPDITLADLAGVIEIAMGWDGSHLHEFQFGKQRYGPPDPQGWPFAMDSQIDEREPQLCQVLLRVGSKGVFTYDFGDNWEHGIVLEKRLPADPDVAYPVCTGGERACPPDDIGGVHGFYSIMEDRPEEFLEWVGEKWDPEEFSIEKVNK